jgi:hypothetical protein
LAIFSTIESLLSLCRSLFVDGLVAGSFGPIAESTFIEARLRPLLRSDSERIYVCETEGWTSDMFGGCLFFCRRFLWRYCFAGKRIVITGGSRGLGIAIARRLAREGASLAIVARDDQELARAKDDLAKFGRPVTTWRCDVRNESDVQSTIKAIGEGPGGIDVLINNAGEIVVGPLLSMTRKDFEDALEIHFWAPLSVTLAALPYLKRQTLPG